MKRLKNLLAGGHATFGPVTIFGDNAMHWAIDVRLPGGLFFCAHPTVGDWPWYVYITSNATPWAALWGAGPGFSRSDRARAKVRLSALRALVHSDWFEGAGCDASDIETEARQRFQDEAA